MVSLLLKSDYLQTANQVTVKDLRGKEADRSFTYDHAMWSHDKFTIDAQGYYHPEPGSNYCD